MSAQLLILLLCAVLATRYQDVYSAASSAEDSPETCGRSFVFTFPASHPNVIHHTYVMVTTLSDEQVTVTTSVPGISFTNTTVISSRSYANVTLPREAVFLREHSLENKTVIVNADRNVCVYAVCTSGSSADGFTVLPTNLMSRRYILASYDPLINYRHPSEFVVTALAEETQITISFNHDGGNEPTVKTLQPYESFQYLDYTHDLTGTLITSNKPVSVMSGNECANVPYTIGKCEFLVAHMSGTDEAGRHFVLAPFLGRTSGYIYRIIALHNNTNVNISSLNSGPIQLSEFGVYEGDVTTDVLSIISSDQNVIVAQYAKGLYSDYKTGDPFMLIVPPTSFFSNNVTFPVTSIPSNAVPQQAYINVIVRCEHNLDIAINGSTEVEWADRLNDGGEFCVKRKLMDVGLHSVGHRSKSATFAVVVYAFVWRASYGYMAGFNLHSSQPTVAGSTVAPTPEPMPLPQDSIVYPDSTGTEFVFAFPTPTSSMVRVYLLITTMTLEPSQVSVSIPGLDLEISQSVSRANFLNLTLPSETIFRTTESGKVQRTVKVNADTRVSVFAVCGGRTTIDAFIVLPKTNYANQYVIASYQPLTSYGHASQFTMSSLSQTTRINITTTHGSSKQISLEPYETYQYRDSARDLTGTRVQSDNPVSVMTGNQCANVPTTTGKCEYLVDHLPPVQSLGRRFVLAPFLGRRSGYVFRVMTTGNSARVALSDGSSFVISAYDFYEQDVTEGDVIIVTSSVPVMVSQFAKGCYSDYLTGDPFMMLIPPVEFYSSSVTFPVTTIATSETQKAYMNIIINCEQYESIVVDGNTYSDYQTLTAEEGLCVLRKQVSVGVHTVWHPSEDARFAVVVYAFAWRASYAYVAGFNLQESVITTASPVTEKGRLMTTEQVAGQHIVISKLPTSTAAITTIKQGNRISNSATTMKSAQKPPQSGGAAGKPGSKPGSKSDGDKQGTGGNAAANTSLDDMDAMKVQQKFMMFLCILTTLLVLFVLFAVLFFWRDWRRLNHRSGSSTSGSSHGHDVDSKSTDGMPLADIEPFTEYDQKPLI